MFLHLILGLLRDGRPRHGYELIGEYTTRAGLNANTGNFYRELPRLAQRGLIDAVENPTGADSRRIPFKITDAGRREFDDWLLAPSTQDEELSSWLMFVDRIPPDELPQLVERLKEQLWLLSKSLTRAREDVLVASRTNGRRSNYNPAAVMMLRRLKQVTADLEFVEELRSELQKLLDVPS